MGCYGLGSLAIESSRSSFSGHIVNKNYLQPAIDNR